MRDRNLRHAILVHVGGYKANKADTYFMRTFSETWHMRQILLILLHNGRNLTSRYVNLALAYEVACAAGVKRRERGKKEREAREP